MVQVLVEEVMLQGEDVHWYLKLAQNDHTWP